MLRRLGILRSASNPLYGFCTECRSTVLWWEPALRTVKKCRLAFARLWRALWSSSFIFLCSTMKMQVFYLPWLRVSGNDGNWKPYSWRQTEFYVNSGSLTLPITSFLDSLPCSLTQKGKFAPFLIGYFGHYSFSTNDWFFLFLQRWGHFCTDEETLETGNFDAYRESKKNNTSEEIYISTLVSSVRKAWFKTNPSPAVPGSLILLKWLVKDAWCPVSS